jgi:glycerol-3-phosphate acyltransferase PlsY
VGVGVQAMSILYRTFCALFRAYKSMSLFNTVLCVFFTENFDTGTCLPFSKCRLLMAWTAFFIVAHPKNIIRTNQCRDMFTNHPVALNGG